MGVKNLTRFPVGKLPIEELERLLRKNKIKDRRVVITGI
jgi:hypothetical protein